MASWQIVAGPQVVAGNGMIATRDIQKGELIHEEIALAIAYSKVGYHQWAQPGRITAFYNAERAAVNPPGRIQRAFTRLNAAEQARLNTLHAPIAGATPVQNAINRFAYNAFDFRKNNMIYLVVYDIFSRINHSCVPNASLEISENALPGQARLIAARTISNGSEILIDYITESWLVPHHVRQQELQNYWGFGCGCGGCTATQIDFHERASAAIYQATLLGPTAQLNPADRSLRVVRLRSYIALMDSLGRWTSDLSHACLVLAQLHFEQAEYAKARFSAIAGLTVERHHYDQVHSVRLNAIIGDCHVQDPSLAAEFVRASLAPYPLM